MYGFGRFLKVSKESPATDVVTALTPAQPFLQLGVKAPGHGSAALRLLWLVCARIVVEGPAGKDGAGSRSLRRYVAIGRQPAATPQAFEGIGGKARQNRTPACLGG
jgi:hypothetical protein